MKLLNIIEAKESRDKEFRKQANEFINKVISWISKNSKTVDQKTQKNKFILKGSFIDNKYKDLEIQFLPNDYASGIKNLPSKYIGSTSINKYNYSLNFPFIFVGGHEELIRKIKKDKSLFVHEFIHYLDFKRRKDFKKDGNKAKDKFLNKVANVINASQKNYANNPEEFNAYYQGIIDKLEVYLEDNPKAIETLKGYNFNNFKSWIITWLKEKWELFEPKTKRKFLLRLFNYWKDLEERIK